MYRRFVLVVVKDDVEDNKPSEEVTVAEWKLPPHPSVDESEFNISMAALVLRLGHPEKDNVGESLRLP